jgi:hypothetical protein
MGFWSIYWPVFAALVSAFAVTELFHLSMGYYLHKKQEKLRKEFEDKVSRGEIDPMQMLFGGFGGPPSFAPLPTVEGTENVAVSAGKPDSGTGQYL